MSGGASPSAGVPLDYLIILDLEATCDDPTDPYRPEIVELPWLVFDLATATARDHKQIFIAPRWNANPNPPPDAVRGLGTDVAFAASLADAILQFDAYIYQSFVIPGKSFYLLTDGPWDLKNYLFVEAARKAVVLAPHFRTFVNLRAEFQRCYPTAPPPTDRKTMFAYLNISTELRVSGLEECAALASVVQCLLRSGHSFSQPEIVSDYEWSTIPTRIPAVATPLASAVPVGGIIRLRGLPWTCTEQDIVEFLHGITIVPAGIHFVRNAHGKATGEAFVQLDSAEAVNVALTRHKEMMGRRYIEVFKSSPVDMSNHLGRADARRHIHAPHMHSNKGQGSVGMHASHETMLSPGGGQAFSSTASPSSQLSEGSSGMDYGASSSLSPHTSAGLAPPAKISSQNFTTPAKASRQQGGRAQKDGAGVSAIPLNHPATVSGSATGVSYVVKVVGLPMNAVADDLLPLFDGLEMVGEGIHVFPAANGLECYGEAYVELTSEVWAKKAIARSGATIRCATGVPAGTTIPNVPVEIRKSSAAQLKAALGILRAGQEARAARSSQNVSEDQRDRGKRNGFGPKSTNGGQGEKRYFVRVRNVSDSVRTEDVRELFESFQIGDEDVKFIKGSMGIGNGSSVDKDKRLSGERVARVAFKSKEARDTALSSNKQLPSLGGYEVELEDGGCDGRNHKPIAGKSSSGPADGSENGSSQVVRMRGLPYTSNEDDIVQFFEGYTIAPGGISRGKDRHGRASGEAWVTFVSAEDAKKVVATLDKAHMGSRYIELKF